MDKKKPNDNATEIQYDESPGNWSGLSFIFSIFLPLAGLGILFKQKNIFSRLLLHLDRNCVSVFCPSLSRREKLLKWAGSRLPETWSSHSRTLAGGVAELWSDGSLLCTLINSVIPGACPNPHRHWKKPPLHAQAIAYKYLGVVPIFTDSDLSGSLTINLERNFLHYLNELQQAITKLSESNDTPKTISLHYIVRGMGLYSGEQHRKTVFYIYPNSNTAGHNSNILVHIRGPYATYGKAVIPKFHNDLFTTPEINITSEKLTTKKLLNGNVVKPNNTFMKNFSLPFMQYHKKHMGDNIVIDVTMEEDRAKITYIPKNYGMYEIIMISNGELLRGCPFNVHVLNNISGIEDSFDAEESADDLLSLRRRKILSKTIDFIDEQMPVTDALMTYKSKANHKPEIQAKNTETNNNFIINNDNDISEKKKTDELLVLPKELCNSVASSDEKNDDDYKEVYNKIPDDIEKLQTDFKEVVNVEKDKVLETVTLDCVTEYPGVKVNSVNGNKLLATCILEEDDQTQNIVQTENNHGDNRNAHKAIYNDVSVGLQLKSTESSNDDKKVDDVLDQKKQMFTIASKPNYIELMSNSDQKLVEVNKIKIPEKFCETENLTKKKIKNEVNTKCFKNFINASSKRELPNEVSSEFYKNDIVNRRISNSTSIIAAKSFTNDDNNNNVTDLNHIEKNRNFLTPSHRTSSKVDIPRKFIQPQNLEPPLYPTNTSPICPNHIVPEVENEYQKMSVAEKRKMFAKKIPDRHSTSTNSSFSETENAEGSPNGGHFRHFEGLSVLNYLGSLKTSESTNKHNGYSLCSTASLPNISCIEINPFQNSVKERRNFWERMSTSSSSLSLNSDVSLKRKPSKMTETERCRLIWKKPVESTVSDFSCNSTEHSDFEKNGEMSKSADDILSLTSFLPQNTPKKFKSMDHSLDKCTMMSIDDRKRILLKQNYEREQSIQPVRCLRNRLKYVNQNKTLIENKRDEESDSFVFSSISDRIKRFDSACNLLNDKKEEERKPNKEETINKKQYPSPNILKRTTRPNSQDLTQREVLTGKSHFKRAIKYFKNLEEKSLHKSKTEKRLSDYKRLPSRRKGGSLNLPSITKRYFVSNLYKDIFGDRKGGFKGAVNRSGLVEALATFSRRENHIFKDDEDKISYEIFQKRAKVKRRRSIKSVFDIYY